MAQAKAPRRPAKKKAATPTPPPAKVRGAALIEAAIAQVSRGDHHVSIEQPAPLTEAQIDALAPGVTLPPSLRAWLRFDAGFLAKRYRWDLRRGLPIRPVAEVIAEHAQELASCYQPVIDRHLPGPALPLDAGSDSMRFLHFGAPDDAGELPVLGVDHDDAPWIGVVWPGVDVWIAAEVGLVPWDTRAYAAANRRASERLFGRAGGIDTLELMGEMDA